TEPTSFRWISWRGSRSMRQRSPLPAVMFFLVVLGSVEALADAATEAKLRDALRSTTAQLRALEAHKAKWQPTKAHLKRQVQTLQSAPAPVQSKSSDRTVTTLQKRLSEQVDTNKKLKDSLARCQAPTAASGAAPELTDGERTRLTAEVTSLRNQLKASET